MYGPEIPHMLGLRYDNARAARKLPYPLSGRTSEKQGSIQLVLTLSLPSFLNVRI